MAVLEFNRVVTDKGATFSSALVSLGQTAEDIYLMPGPMCDLHGYDWSPEWEDVKKELYEALEDAEKVKIYGFFGGHEAFFQFNPQDDEHVDVYNTEDFIEIKFRD